MEGREEDQVRGVRELLGGWRGERRRELLGGWRGEEDQVRRVRELLGG